jgi:hAT family C-terminal dimerisation region
LEFCADIEEYWRSNSKRWPSLAYVASLYLCVPASTKIMQSLASVSSGHGENTVVGDALSRQLLFIRQNLLSGVTFGVPDLDSHG